MAPAEHEPDGLDGLVSDRRESMGLRAVEGDRVAASELVALEADRDAKASAEDVAVLFAVVPHERFGCGRFAAWLVAEEEKVDVVVWVCCQPLPADA